MPRRGKCITTRVLIILVLITAKSLPCGTTAADCDGDDHYRLSGGQSSHDWETGEVEHYSTATTATASGK